MNVWLQLVLTPVLALWYPNCTCYSYYESVMQQLLLAINSMDVGVGRFLLKNILVPVYSYWYATKWTLGMYRYGAEKEVKRDRVVMYVHGGGFVTGDARMHSRFLSLLQRRLDMDVYSVCYGLAPIYTVKDSIRDVLKAYERLVKVNMNIILIGDSAGAHLILQVLGKVSIQPKKVVLISPWINPTRRVYDTKWNKDVLNSEIILRWASCNSKLENLLTCTLKLPDTLVIGGQNELFIDDILSFSKKYKVQMYLHPYLFHDFCLVLGLEKQTLLKISSFLT